MMPIRTILHPTDFSTHSDFALRVAAALARDHGSRVIVLHALRGAELPDWLHDRMAGESPWPEAPAVALERRLKQLREAVPGLRAESRVVEGLPGEEILKAAGALGCDLIVMGTHGQQTQDRTIMGSVAEQVVRDARCPVLTVRNPPPEELEAGAVVVVDVEGTSRTVPSKEVYHRDFPEIRAGCGSVPEGVARLAEQLSLARDNVGSEWRRQGIDRALFQLAAFRDSLPDAAIDAPLNRCEPCASVLRSASPLHGGPTTSP